jgi:hypothetical protein
VLEAGNSGATRLVAEREALGRLKESETIDYIVEATELEPTFIKLDVEGGELAALRGADATVKRLRPTLVVEVSDAQLLALGDSARKLDRWLVDHGYDAFVITGDRNGRSPVWQLEPVVGSLDQVPGDLFDIVARPKGAAPLRSVSASDDD